jgi:hypothetical protein
MKSTGDHVIAGVLLTKRERPVEMRTRHHAMKFRAIAYIISVLPIFVNAASLSLESHEIGTRDTFQSHWETDWGSYDRDYARGKRILVTVRDFSRKVPSCDVAVYFIARPLFTAAGRFIYDRKEFSPQFRGRLEISGPVSSQDLHARILNLAALGQKYGSGAEMDGWIVVGKLEGRVFDIRASSQTLLEIAHENPRQPESLRQMIADYEKVVAK